MTLFDPNRRELLLGGAGMAFLSATSGGCATNRAQGPNIVWVMPDQLRCQSLRCMNPAAPDTSGLDSLLADGAFFRQAVTPDPVCGPARSSLMSSQMPRQHGHIGNGRAFVPNAPTVSELMGEAGYRCGYVGKWHMAKHTEDGFVGTDQRHGFVDYWAANNSEHQYRNASYFFGDEKEARSAGDQFEPLLQNELAMDFAEQDDARPFFMVVSYGPPHPPGHAPGADWTRHVPERFMAEIDPNQISLPVNLNTARARHYGDDAPKQIIEHLHGYYAAILAIQDAILELVAGLDTVTRDTVVMFFSDHGELGGSHGGFRKNQPYEEAVRIPMGIRWPGVISPNQTFDFPTSLLDIAPTTLALAGVEPGAAMVGNDLSSWLIGDAESAVEPTESLIEANLDSDEEWTAVRTASHTFVERVSGEREIYNNLDDPHQMFNLAAKS